MQTDPRYLELLRDRYRFAEWTSATPGRQAPLLQAEPFAGIDLAGWSLQRRTLRTDASSGVVALRGIWAGAGDNADGRLIDVELWECRSAAEAREYLLAILGDLQAPAATRIADTPFADVAFSLGGDGAIAFVRGNIVVRIRNAGPSITPVSHVAEAVGTRLTSDR